MKPRSALLLATVVVTTLVLFTGASSSAPAGPPSGLTRYGRYVWNLDALVGDSFGGGRTCLRQKNASIHRCTLPHYGDGAYQRVFFHTTGSNFAAESRTSNPLAGVNVLPLKIGSKYVSCGAGRWLAITNAPTGWGSPSTASGRN